MWSTCVGVCQLLNWKMHGETLKFAKFIFVGKKSWFFQNTNLVTFYLKIPCKLLLDNSLKLLKLTFFLRLVNNIYLLKYNQNKINAKYPSVLATLITLYF